MAGLAVTLFERGGWAVYDEHCCRMGDDQKKSTVNSYGQVHEIDNLFVADGSVTCGGMNPALTIMALAYRTGEYIVKNINSIPRR